MRKISMTIVNNNMHMKIISPESWHSQDGICIDFFINRENVPQKELIPIIKTFTSDINWIHWQGNNLLLNLEEVKASFKDLFEGCNWMKGKIKVEPSFDEELHTEIPIVSYELTKSRIESKHPKKIFLSHKGSNKPFVKNFYDILKEIGFDPWLDEEDMPAGIDPSRGILKGLQESCACIFFITPEFKDEEYLEFEINCAQRQKTLRGNKFSIITLQFQNEEGKVGVIPEILELSLWKTPKDKIEALKHILRALPIKTGYIEWK